MICCKECLDLLCDYLEGNLGAETTKLLEEHFEDCPPCIAFLNTYKSTTKICRETLNQVKIPEPVRDSLLKFLKDHREIN